MLVGSIVSGLGAYAAVRWLTRWFTTRTLTPFGIYRLLAAGLLGAGPGRRGGRSAGPGRGRRWVGRRHRPWSRTAAGQPAGAIPFTPAM